MNDVSKMEGITNFSRRLKQFDGLTWLTLTTIILWQIYATACWTLYTLASYLRQSISWSSGSQGLVVLRLT